MKPILFNTEMVRAILEGRKTVTRRVLKEPFEIHPNGLITKPRGNERLCPYEPPYKVNDVLYVRETWYKGLNRILYKANYSDTERFYENGKEILLKWKPSIHMPREAARIFLRVTGVRVERLHDITNEQILAEGIDKKQIENILSQMPEPADEWERACYTLEWANLWDSTVKHISHSWKCNPFVWVIEFERITKEQAYELDRQQS